MQLKKHQAVVAGVVQVCVNRHALCLALVTAHQVVRPLAMSLAEAAAEVVATTLAPAVAKTPAPVVVEIPPANSSDLFIRL